MKRSYNCLRPGCLSSLEHVLTQPLGLMGRGFESGRGHGCFSLSFIFVCCCGRMYESADQDEETAIIVP